MKITYLLDRGKRIYLEEVSEQVFWFYLSPKNYTHTQKNGQIYHNFFRSEGLDSGMIEYELTGEIDQ